MKSFLGQIKSLLIKEVPHVDVLCVRNALYHTHGYTFRQADDGHS